MRNTLVTIAGTTLVPCILHIMIPNSIIKATSSSVPNHLGIIEIGSIVLAILGICMVIWVSVTFVRSGKGTAAPPLPPKKFVAIGLFRMVRNPMYVGLLLVIIAEAIFFRSLWLLWYASLVWLATHSYVVLVEEPRLERRFGGTYTEYLKHVPRWIPRLPHNRSA